MRFVTTQLQTRRAGASRQIDQCSRGADNVDDFALLLSPQSFEFFGETELSPQSGAHFADRIFQKCSTHIIFLATVLCAELIFQKCSAPVSF